MIRLLPSTDAQTIAVIPREFPTVDVSFDNISLLIKEDGTDINEELNYLEATISNENSNYVNITISSTILREGYAYYLEFKNNTLEFRKRVIEDGGIYESSDCINKFLDNFDRVLWFRDKAYVSSQTDNEVIHTINKDKYKNYVGAGQTEYIVL